MKRILRVLAAELTLRSQRPGLGSDTFPKLLLMLSVCAGFYLWVHGFNYDDPQPRKVAWHRTVATGMTALGVFVSLSEYCVCLWRRLREAAGK